MCGQTRNNKLLMNESFMQNFIQIQQPEQRKAKPAQLKIIFTHVARN